MKVVATKSFIKSKKKLHKNQIIDLNKAVKKIIANPLIGERKKYDLDFLRVYKFKMAKQLTLLAYSYSENSLILTLIDFGAHENFYQRLQRKNMN
ncbi:type II toxin-antitoxin system RelE/ParE family toxin [Endozoicomonas sp. 4G]|uniref:type II toxin-antitoxin system RelE/ParE family toxin n=1 Tax=Endozoicomonas sp. 4G TaxID=2872754 RepID=UPI002078EAEC|nr:type II toxin-antitoxin system RelE/ParE family toxin [Endozoicomonas sp. 4G]